MPPWLPCIRWYHAVSQPTAQLLFKSSGTMSETLSEVSQKEYFPLLHEIHDKAWPICWLTLNITSLTY